MTEVSTVYKGNNKIPVNFQAVKEFFRDHYRLDYENLDETRKKEILFDLSLFFKPNDKNKNLIFINEKIDIKDYLRVVTVLKKIGNNAPNERRKLIMTILHHCRHDFKNNPEKQSRNYALLIINEMIDQKFIIMYKKTMLYKHDLIDLGLKVCN